MAPREYTGTDIKKSLPQSEDEKRFRQVSYYEGDGELDAKSDAYFSDLLETDTDKVEHIKAIEDLSGTLRTKRAHAVSARAACGIEQIWREDELAIEGMDEATLNNRMIDNATKESSPQASFKGPRRSRVVINVTRPKCETAEGRFADIQFPTDDRNWGYKTTPMPELDKAIDDDTPAYRYGDDTNPLYKRQDGKIDDVEAEGSQPATKADVAYYRKADADKRMLGMQAVVDDQLVECDFNAECRLVIRDGVRLGTGVLKGPVPSRELRKNWVRKEETDEDGNTTVVRVLERSQDLTPISKRVDPWDMFPDPECKEDVTRAGYMWERSAVLPRELRNLIGVDGYIDDQLLRVLSEEPTRITVATPKENQYILKYNTIGQGSSYEMWEFTGDLDKEDLEALGCDCGEVMTESVSANVLMVNDHPIKVELNLMDTGDLPYDFFHWSLRTGIPWGIGIPREIVWQQRIIIAAWRAMMDNAGDSAGANIILGANVEPMDQVWEISGKKLWRDMSENGDLDVSKAFKQFQIDNNQQELEAIINLTLQFIDLETAIPMIFQGEKQQIPKTLGATNILVDAQNVALRARVKIWDDNITDRHLTRYYDWNMQYHPDDEIKGDMRVDARGVSILLARDSEAQDIKEILGMREDPELKIMVDWDKAIDEYYRARNLDILLPKDKIAAKRKELAEQEPPVDPALQAAQIRSDTELQKAQLSAQTEERKAQFEAEVEARRQQHELQLKAMEVDLKVMELSGKMNLGISEIKKDLSINTQKITAQVSLAKDKDVKPAEQIVNPPMEPAGRAKDGEAFQA